MLKEKTQEHLGPTLLPNHFKDIDIHSFKQGLPVMFFPGKVVFFIEKNNIQGDGAGCGCWVEVIDSRPTNYPLK